MYLANPFTKDCSRASFLRPNALKTIFVVLVLPFVVCFVLLLLCFVVVFRCCLCILIGVLVVLAVRRRKTV